MRIEEVVEKIKNKEITRLNDFTFSIEEYLTNIDGMTLLDYILKNDVYMSYKEEVKLKNSKEAAYIYVNNGKSLYGFDFTEDELFSEINGERFIDFLAQKSKLTSSMIKKINNNFEIIDISIKANQTYLCSYFNTQFIEKLMTPDTNGIYPIEKYIDNKSVMNEVIVLINEPKKLIEICTKHNKYDLLTLANENVLMHRISEDMTLFDNICSKEMIPKKLINIPPNINFINYLRDKKLYNYLQDSTENVLLLEVESGKTLLEELIEKNSISKVSISDIKTARILYKKNRLDLVKNCNDRILFSKANELLNDENIFEDQTFFEYLLDNGINPLTELYKISDEKLIKILLDKGYYNFLSEKVDPNKLLIKFDDEKTVLDNLLDNNCEIKFGDINLKEAFNKEEIAKKVFEKGRYDLLVKGTLDTLLTLENSENTYLDHILEAIKSKKIQYKLKKIVSKEYSANVIAKYYLALAKHEMIEYIDPLDENELLTEYNGKTLLDELLDLDSELALNNVISNNAKSKMKIAIILKSRGLEPKDIDVPLEQSHFTGKYLEGVQKNLGIGPFLSEGEELLNKLQQLFFSDGKSDINLVSALISGYRHALLVNYEVNIQELRNLVDIKENNIEKFIYVKQEDNSFFNGSTGAVHCEAPVVETILHETGHALHHYLAGSNIPEEYNEYIEKARLNPQTLRNVELYAQKYDVLKTRLFDIAEEKYNTFFESYFDSSRIDSITKFLEKSQMEKQEEFKSLGISEESLDIILDNIFTSEEYIDHQKKIFINESADHMMRSEFGAFMALGDILDAIYAGELHSGALKNEKGDKINRTSGHGISYYYDKPNRGFSEMIANFASIEKSKDSREVLLLLKQIVGEDVYNMLTQYYYNNIVTYNYEKEEAKSI